MTDYYKLLGVEKNASKEEVKEAYEKQVEKIRKEVVNEKRLDQFLKMFDEAYEALLSNLKENQSGNKVINEDETLIMSSKEVQKEIEEGNKDNNYLYGSNTKRKKRSDRIQNNDFAEKRSSKGKDKRNKLSDNKEVNSRKQKAAEKDHKDNNTMLGLLMLPIKILVLPFIAVLTVIIFILQIIKIISWVVTKLLIVGSISAGAIHLYQVKLGQTINYNILILAGSVLVGSFFLPYILKFVLMIMQNLNNRLKKVAF